MPLTRYFVDFTAHIDETRRPENFPHEIHDKKMFEVESLGHLKHAVNERFVQLISASGMVTPKDDSDIQDEQRVNFDKFVYVPWHMITHVTLSATLVPTLPSSQDSIVPGFVTPDKPKEWVN
jgi:hypothetical protein